MNYPSTIPAPHPPTRCANRACRVTLYAGEGVPVTKRAVLCGPCAEGLEARAAAVEALEYE